MSTGAEDYIIFDYVRYAREIIPLVEQVRQGNSQPLHAFILATASQSAYVPAPTLLHFNDQRSRDWGFTPQLLETLRVHQALATAQNAQWEALIQALDGLQERKPDGTLLQTYLLATYCCEALPWSPNWHWPYHGDFILDHSERIQEWYAYTHRDEEQAALWEPFTQPVPEPLAHQLQIDWQSLSVYDRAYWPRALRGLYLRGEINGFMLLEEIQKLLEQIRLRALTQTDQLAILMEAVSDCPSEEVERYREDYWKALWMIEDELLYRLRYAFAHGKGILTYVI